MSYDDSVDHADYVALLPTYLSVDGITNSRSPVVWSFNYEQPFGPSAVRHTNEYYICAPLTVTMTNLLRSAFP